MKELSNCNTILIKHNGNHYAFDYINYEILKLDLAQKTIFESLIKNKIIPYNSSSQQDLIKILLKIKSGFFFTEKPISLYTGKDNERSCIISFPIVHSCNLKCKYCYAKSGTTYHGVNKCFEIGTVNKVFEFLSLMFDKPISSIRLEFVSGGETLINQKLYEEIITHINRISILNNIQLEIFTLTNGTLLNENIIKFLNMNNNMLGISIDGPANIHDFQRPFVNGEGTYNVVINNIREMMRCSQNNNIWAVSVITSVTNSLIDILNHHKSIGIKSMEMRIVRGKNDYGLSISENNIEHFKNLYYEFSEYLKAHPSDLYFIVNNYDTFGKIIKRLLVGEKVVYRCQAGKNKFSFTADGDVYPCDSFVGQDEYKIGNIFSGQHNDELRDRFYNMSVDSLQGCRICEFRYLCGGDCYYNNIFNEQSQLYCELRKYLCVLSVDLIYYIKNSYNDIYIKLVSFAKLRDIMK